MLLTGPSVFVAFEDWLDALAAGRCKRSNYCWAFMKEGAIEGTALGSCRADEDVGAADVAADGAADGAAAIGGGGGGGGTAGLAACVASIINCDSAIVTTS